MEKISTSNQEVVIIKQGKKKDKEFKKNKTISTKRPGGVSNEDSSCL